MSDFDQFVPEWWFPGHLCHIFSWYLKIHFNILNSKSTIPPKINSQLLLPDFYMDGVQFMFVILYIFFVRWDLLIILNVSLSLPEINSCLQGGSAWATFKIGCVKSTLSFEQYWDRKFASVQGQCWCWTRHQVKEELLPVLTPWKQNCPGFVSSYLLVYQFFTLSSFPFYYFLSHQLIQFRQIMSL